VKERERRSAKGDERMRLNPEALARASSKHPWRTLGVWVVLIVTMFGVSGALLSGVLTQDIAFTNSPESVRAQDILDTKFSAGGKQPASTEFFVIQSASTTVDDPDFKTLVQGVESDVAAKTDILDGQPFSYYDALDQAPDQAASLVSKDQKVTLVSVPLDNTDTSSIDTLRSIASDHQVSGFTVQVAGPSTLGADFTKIAEEDLKKGESVGTGIALLVLIVVFAAILAALLPIVMAIFAIGVALGLVALIGQVFQFNLFVENMVTMIGLAVGIDYSLFIVSRYREERKKGFDKLEAIGASGATANRAVFFSGLTVVLALLGMFIIPTTIFRSLAGGAILVTLASLAASMTLLPAILALLGDRIDWPWLSPIANILAFIGLVVIAGLVGGVVGGVGAPPIVVVLSVVAALIGASVFLTRALRRGQVRVLTRFARPSGSGEHDPRGGVWDRITRRVMAQPVAFLVISVLALAVLGSFYFQMHRGTSQNVSTLPDDIQSKQAFIVLQREFGGGRTDPVQIVVTGEVGSPTVQAAIGRLQQGIAGSDLFSDQTRVIDSQDGTAVEVDAFFQADPSSDAAFSGIRTLRNEIVPAAFQGVSNAQVLVGGNTAFFTDFLSVANSYQWIVLAFVLALSFMLLTVVFRSIVVPLTAIIMNLLSVGAAYGAVTLVFQKGVGTGFFNAIGFQFQKTDAIEAWLPLFLFSILFGLSMDYHVFLLSRIREEFDKTKDNSEAVAYGLRTTAGIITGAALIMVAVFTGFAAGRLGPLQQMGFGLAVAVFMDATIVRTLLVPATMRLLGKRNWYLPRWLNWLPQVHVEGHEPTMSAAPEPPVLVSTDGQGRP
jgi:putative drug exporter of the RND superfamily